MTSEIDALKLRHQYYTSFPVMRNITTFLRGRYFAFVNRDVTTCKACKEKIWACQCPEGILPKTCPKCNSTKVGTAPNRYNRGHHSNEFLKVYKRYQLYNVRYCRVYYSLTMLNSDFPLPPWTFKKDERKKIKEMIVKTLIDNPSKWVTGYDIGYDLDFKPEDGITEEKLMADTKKLLKFFLDYGVGVSVRPSGRRGMHIVIPAETIPEPIHHDMERIKKFTRKVALFHNTLCIDTFGNDTAKLLKLPYGVDGKAPNFNVVLPLTLDELENYKPEMIKLENVMKHRRLLDKYKGPLLNNLIGYKGETQNGINILKMFDDVENW